MRTTLYAGENPFVSLEKELEFLDLYLEIEFLRFSDRLKVEKNILQECLQAKVPYLIPQPLIENAIKYGIARHSSAKLLGIQAQLVNNFLYICIFNEGKLLPENGVAQENWNVGLNNVYSRLQGIYGSEFSFQIENHPEGKGVQPAL